MAENSITLDKEGKIICYSGEAVKIPQMIALAYSIKLYAETGIIPTRGYGITKMLKRAEELTGTHYKRNNLAQAWADLLHISNNLKAAAPKVQS